MYVSVFMCNLFCIPLFEALRRFYVRKTHTHTQSEKKKSYTPLENLSNEHGNVQRNIYIPIGKFGRKKDMEKVFRYVW